MSTRWYPIYKRGNPQLRVFLTDFWMKMVRNDKQPTPPPNVVTFHCSMEMTKHDIKNYLTKIYDIPVVDVHTEVRMGEFFRDPVKKYVKKKDDFRVAVVTLPKDMEFEFPDLFEKTTIKEDQEKAKESLDMQKQSFRKFSERNKDSRATPPWFSF